MRFVGLTSEQTNGSTTVAFDCDGTLIDETNRPRHEIIQLFLAYQALGCVMVVWSGGGEDYARTVANRLGLEPDAIRAKSCGMKVDIAVDDIGMGKDQCKVCLRV